MGIGNTISAFWPTRNQRQLAADCRAAAPGAAPRFPAQSYQVGDRVEVRLRDGHWYSGSVQRVTSNGAYAYAYTVTVRLLCNAVSRHNAVLAGWDGSPIEVLSTSRVLRKPLQFITRAGGSGR